MNKEKKSFLSKFFYTEETKELCTFKNMYLNGCMMENTQNVQKTQGMKRNLYNNEKTIYTWLWCTGELSSVLPNYHPVTIGELQASILLSYWAASAGIYGVNDICKGVHKMSQNIHRVSQFICMSRRRTKYSCLNFEQVQNNLHNKCSSKQSIQAS